jgi:environmental stress-induced protein Ves
MRTFSAADYKTMPWKNGGGSTIELALAPAGAGLDDFDWRISSAQVSKSGPFSLFAGIDRSLAILDGNGLSLRIEQQEPMRLTPASAPFVFAGERHINAELLDGSVTDFNVMTRRACWQHQLQRLVLNDTTISTVLTRETDQMFIYCAAGKVRCQPQEAVPEAALTAGEALLTDHHDESRWLLQAAAPTILYLVHLTSQGKTNG